MMRIIYQSILPSIHHLFWEVRKGFKNTYFKKEVLILKLCLWPIVNLTILIYLYSPFLGSDGWKKPLDFTSNLPLSSFLLVGTFVLGVFSEYISIGFQMATQRDQGVLETILISPVNRLRYLIGNALNCTLTGLLTLLLYLFLGVNLFQIQITHPFVLILVIFAFVLTSIPWGAFLCSIFLLGRNSRIIYSLFEEPADFLSGVKFPVKALPIVFFYLSSIYPITHDVILVRAAFAHFIDWRIIRKEFLWLIILSFLYLFAADLLIKIAERSGRKKGTLSYS